MKSLVIVTQWIQVLLTALLLATATGKSIFIQLAAIIRYLYLILVLLSLKQNSRLYNKLLLFAPTKINQSPIKSSIRPMELFGLMEIN